MFILSVLSLAKKPVFTEGLKNRVINFEDVLSSHLSSRLYDTLRRIMI